MLTFSAMVISQAIDDMTTNTSALVTYSPYCIDCLVGNTSEPTGLPTAEPSLVPSVKPSQSPTSFPTQIPTSMPTHSPIATEKQKSTVVILILTIMFTGAFLTFCLVSISRNKNEYRKARVGFDEGSVSLKEEPNLEAGGGRGIPTRNFGTRILQSKTSSGLPSKVPKRDFAYNHSAELI